MDVHTDDGCKKADVWCVEGVKWMYTLMMGVRRPMCDVLKVCSGCTL